ncbi:PTS sugar transporter subunit IIB [Pediococcus pentosaceus]|jgi:mannose/fructose/N-acetylgalactosamine-specific phosphotransferase system component IIB|uniref:PTS mannose/fructose/sorbose transporter subunit IIB n=1 Tax=Pediococcus pentosaceus TaxID=1255 RepID=A0ABQ6XEZ6_PEDPE|nr:PTS sugar transporter subunit IIB [Pediococcus pentosaceus]KAF0412467.1 PTS mannose/fructose/sorbose transporter subunit IIB [Pediococcus pentosaceus]KAF0501457.1 PTS mannose/fructose/sorbose transporter subunit IIB [Pediococcus pentosaceus]
MILSLRVDERLIHGQIAMSWSKALNLQGIVVANDEAAIDDLQKMSLKMAAPNGVKAIILSVSDAINLLNDERSKKMRLMVITTTIKDALVVSDGINEKAEQVNIGNAGKMHPNGNEVTMTKEVRLIPEEIENLKELIEVYPDVFFQGTPNMEKHMGKDILKDIK